MFWLEIGYTNGVFFGGNGHHKIGKRPKWNLISNMLWMNILHNQVVPNLGCELTIKMYP